MLLFFLLSKLKYRAHSTAIQFNHTLCAVLLLCCCCARTGFESNPILFACYRFLSFEKKRGRRPAGGPYLFKYNLYIGRDNIFDKKNFCSRLCFFTLPGLATLITQKIHKYIFFDFFNCTHKHTQNTHKT